MAMPLFEWGASATGVLITDNSHGPCGDGLSVRLNRQEYESYFGRFLFEMWPLARRAKSTAPCQGICEDMMAGAVHVSQRQQAAAGPAR
jgi:hypothetical protein